MNKNDELPDKSLAVKQKSGKFEIPEISTAVPGILPNFLKTWLRINKCNL